jgi:hypothetical protein
MWVGSQRHTPAAFLPGKTRDTHCTGDWVGLRASLDGRFDPRTVQPVASHYTDCADSAHHTYLLGLYNLPKPGGHYMYRQFNIRQFHVLPTQCVEVFCMGLRTNSDYFPIQH